MLQLVLKFDDTSKIEETIDKLSKNVLAFHLKTDEYHFYKQKSNITPVKIIESDNLPDLATYMYENHSPDFSKTLATLGYNSNTLVLNIAHLVADGGYLHQIVDLILSDSDKLNTKLEFPDNIEENFINQINSKYIDQCKYIFTDPEIIRINADKPKNPSNKYAKHCYINTPVENLKCFSKKSKRVSGLTEVLWTSYILSASAMNKKINNTGIATCIDMRNYFNQINKTNSLSVCNHYSNITPCSNISPSMTVGELGKQMRKDFNDKIKKGHHYSFLKSLVPPEAKAIPGIGLELSNIGRFQIKSPLKDLFLKSSVFDQFCDPLISHSSFSVDTGVKNTLHGMFRFKPSAIKEETVRELASKVKFSLQNISNDMTVAESISLIQKSN